MRAARQGGARSAGMLPRLRHVAARRTQILGAGPVSRPLAREWWGRAWGVAIPRSNSCPRRRADEHLPTSGVFLQECGLECRLRIGDVEDMGGKAAQGSMCGEE